jgi:D-lactate dehydrogenase
MKLSVFSAKPYDKRFLDAANTSDGRTATSVTYHDVALNEETCSLVSPGAADAVCVFVNDVLSRPVLTTLHSRGVRAVLLRCAGFNNVDLEAATELGLSIANVPSYSPEAVAEFAVALTQTLNRKTHRAYNRVREGNFALDGLLGRTLHGKTVGVIGTGRIGIAAARIFGGFGCRLLAHDVYHNEILDKELGGEYRDSLDDMLPECDVVSLHCPLTEQTRHLVSASTIAKMKRGVLLVNTSRGGLVDTKAVIHALKTGHLGGVALDVYEGEGSLFYDDHSGDVIHDDVLMRLMTFPNVIVCGHQAFFTEEALTEIAQSTLRNLDQLSADPESCPNLLTKSSPAKQPAAGANPVRTI